MVLEAILVPTSDNSRTDKERAQAGADLYHSCEENVPKVIVTGGNLGRYFPGFHPGSIYRTMRKEEVPRDAFLFEANSLNTAENVAYSSVLLKRYEAKIINVVSNPSHLWRFNFLFKKAKKEGLIDSDVKIQYIPTRKNILFEDAFDAIYGVVAYAKEIIKWRNKPLKSLKEQYTNFY